MRTDTDVVDAVRDTTLHRLVWGRWIMDSMLTPLTDAQVMHRAGGTGNHALWVMGHIASVDAYFLSSLGGRPAIFDERFMKLFQGGSECSDDPRVYPSRREVAAGMATAREQFLKWWGVLSPGELDRELEGEAKRFSQDVRSLGVTVAMHEMIHAGQVASCRASLGLPRVLR